MTTSNFFFYFGRFSEKTANQWSDRNNFQSYRGKYTLIELDYGDAEEPNEEKKLSLRKTTNQDNENKNDNEHESEDEDEEDGDDDNDPHFDTNNVKSNLPQSVFELVSLIFDKSAMTHQMMAMNYDVQKMPLGKLKKSTITKGMDVLKKIEKALQEGKKHELVTLSSQFYTLIPHSFGMSVPPIINTPQMLQEKLQMLETLSDIHLANTLSKQSRQQRVQDKTPLHPVDAKYAQLKTKLIPLLPNDPMYQLIVKYVQSTHGVTHNQYTLRVCDVFRVEREGERARFQQCCASLMTDSKKSTSTDAPLKPTVHLLWHGSRISNFVGILSQGLRIAPPSAPSTGYMFGKGIYFADCCSKSANYCHVDYNKLNSPTAKLSYPDNIGTFVLQTYIRSFTFLL
jgi:poly [ADP-ribose] polymerase